jgi:hypothetical protein
LPHPLSLFPDFCTQFAEVLAEGSDAYYKKNLCVQVDQISPGISERYLLDPARFQTELTEYHSYIRDMVQVFQDHLPNSTAHNSTLFADDVLHFSTQLAAVSIQPSDQYITRIMNLIRPNTSSVNKMSRQEGNVSIPVSPNFIFKMTYRMDFSKIMCCMVALNSVAL